MRVAITTRGADLSAQVDPSFEGAGSFIMVETQTMKHHLIKNDQPLPQEAGIQAARNILPHYPEVILTGSCGPDAFRILQGEKVKVVLGVKGRISDAIRDWLEGKYTPASNASKAG